MSRAIRGKPGTTSRRPAWRLRTGIFLAFGAVVPLASCEPETAPNIPVGPPPRVRSEVGPWFVDRARDYGLDIVTPCGGPEKLSVVESLGAGLALFDHDGDGDLDLFVTACSRVVDATIRPAGGPWLFRNDGPGRWTDVTASSGLAYTGWAQAAAVADYDGDGDLDLFVAHLGPDVLWQNQGDGTFLDVTESAGLGRDALWGVGATWGDVDGDGWPDLYVTNYLEADPCHPAPPLDYVPGVKVFNGPSVLPGQPDRFWRNRGDGTFEDATESAGLANPDGKGMAALFVDLDEDGRVELFVTNDTQPNEFFRNVGEGRFREDGLASGLAINGVGRPEGSMGIDVADVDGDGRLDLVHTNFRQEGTRLFRNLGECQFQDISTGTYVNVNTLRFVGWGVVLGDFNADGWPDLFQANGHVYPKVPDSDYAQSPYFMENRGEGRFRPATEGWGPSEATAAIGGRSVATGDLDGDGDLDLVVTTMDGPLSVLINEGTTTHHSTRLRLVGRPPNREALGARIELRAGGRSQVGQVRRGGGYLSASDIAPHFGLGDADRIESLTVHWPDGTTQTLDDLPADSTIVVRQGDGRAEALPFRKAEPAPPDHPRRTVP
ncbi:CRTAC1 family protein [Tundrisphaera lichenicola]|uniref:CRTAC1 family protein n=1 Tax=Tundrisphaera lichenicola TaxID=2029860 RepID=UPI003EB86965